MAMEYNTFSRFFIGGTPELEDIRYVGSGAGQGGGGAGGVVSKLGFQTRAAGSVVVRLEAVHQAKVGPLLRNFLPM